MLYVTKNTDPDLPKSAWAVAYEMMDAEPAAGAWIGRPDFNLLPAGWPALVELYDLDDYLPVPAGDGLARLGLEEKLKSYLHMGKYIYWSFSDPDWGQDSSGKFYTHMRVVHGYEEDTKSGNVYFHGMDPDPNQDNQPYVSESILPDQMYVFMTKRPNLEWTG